MILSIASFVLIMIVPRTLGVPFSSCVRSTLPIPPPAAAGIPVVESSTNNEIPISTSMEEVPPGYSPTAPPLELTVYPSSRASQTVTVTQPAYTVTVTSTPQTVVTTTTVSHTPLDPSSMSRVSSASSTSVASSEVHSQPTEWILPHQFTSMEEAFNIEHYAFGRNNVQLNSITRGDLETAAGDGKHGTGQTILEVIYPRGSYSPSHAPRGGTDFYAVPSFTKSSYSPEGPGLTFDSKELLRYANNVTMSYSVFFPDIFDFVKGGKLPGLYGGHERCSGGDDGLGCFSTRLMWRGGGKGELYLYAPKDRQPLSLCSTPPRSICDSAYGLSIGRGSFSFQRGGWTHISQTVWLNTPGSTNGGFVLQVGNDNDPNSMKTVMSNAEAFYRDVPVGAGDFESASIGDIYGEDDEPGRTMYEDSDEWNPVGNLLSVESKPLSPDLHIPQISGAKATVYIVGGTHTVTAPNYQTVTITATLNAGPTAPSIIPNDHGRVKSGRAPARDILPVGFIGIFFSTFFGGSTPDWASPKDQSASFKDFKLVVNA